MDVGHLRLNIEPLNLQDAISSAVALQSPALQSKRQVMQVVLPEVPIALEADPVRLEQILRNVLDNSIKYTPASGHLWVTATVEADKAVIRIQDDGDGMDAETLPEVFEMFTRGEKAMDSASDGLGIGLAVVKNLVQLHGGIIEVQSGGQGRGTEFTLKFPLAQKDARLNQSSRPPRLSKLPRGVTGHSVERGKAATCALSAVAE